MTSSIWESGVTGPPGPPGEPAILRVTTTHIQWSVQGTDVWTDLISIAELIGPPGESIQGPIGPQGPPGESIQGPPGATGATGPAGPKTSILSDSGPPLNTAGIDGDYYLNLLNGDFYGPKAGGVWPGSPAMNLKGPTGATGATGSTGATGPTGPAGQSSIIYNAAGVPGSGVGSNGDYYINSTNGDMYGPKAAGAWPGSPFTNIKGPAGSTSKLLRVVDSKTLGTNGGTQTLGAWRTRDLNGVVINEITGASLASNQVTLPIGTYDVTGLSSAFAVGMIKLRIARVSDSATLLEGKNVGYINTSNHSDTSPVITGRFTLTVATVVELQMWSSATRATDGQGSSMNIGTNELYTTLDFRQI